MARHLEYLLAAPLDGVFAQQARLALLKKPGVNKVQIDPVRRSLVALVEDDLSPDSFAEHMAQVGLYPEFQRGAFVIYPPGWEFASFRLRARFKRLPGVKLIKFNPLSRLLFVKYDRNRFDPRAIKRVLGAMGLVATETGAVARNAENDARLGLRVLKNLSWALALAVACAVAEAFSKNRLAGLISGLSLFWPGLFLLQRALGRLIRGDLDRSLGGLLVAVGLWVHGILGLFLGWETFFLIPSLIIALLLAWEWWDRWLGSKVRAEITQLLSRLPLWARVERGGRVVEVSGDDVEPGETVIVEAGERVPVDGVVVEGSGETESGHVETGDRVHMPVLLTAGRLKIRARASYRDCFYMRSVHVAEEALSSGSQSRTLLLFTLFTYVLLLSGPVLAWFLGPQALVLLALPLPQALGLAVEWHRLAGVRKAMKKGVIFKDAHRIHSFLRTNTLLVPLGSFLGPYRLVQAEEEGLAVASALLDGIEAKPARALGPSPLKAQKRKHILEMGVSGLVEGKKWSLGCKRFVKEPGPFPDEKKGLFPLFLESEGARGVLGFSREERPGARELVGFRWRKGVMVTSAPKATAGFWAEKWGLKEVYAEAVPGGKLQVLWNLRKKGERVLYVDDEPHRKDMQDAAFWGMSLAERFLDTEASGAVIVGGDLSSVLRARTAVARSMAATGLGMFLVAAGTAALCWGAYTGFLSPEVFLLLAYPLLFLLALI